MLGRKMPKYVEGHYFRPCNRQIPPHNTAYYLPIPCQSIVNKKISLISYLHFDQEEFEYVELSGKTDFTE